MRKSLPVARRLRCARVGLFLALGACGDATTPVTPAPDTIAPTVAVVLPATDTLYPPTVGVAPERQIRGVASDTVGVVRAAYRLNDGPEIEVPVTPGTSALISFAVRISEGDNDLVLYAYDAAGNRAASPVRKLRQDVAPPQVEVLSPAPGAAVQTASMTLRLRASDPSGLDRVQYQLNLGFLYTVAIGDTATIVEIPFTLAPGRSRVDVSVYDRNGNRSLHIWEFRRTGLRFQDVAVGEGGFCGVDMEGVAYCQGVDSPRLARPEGETRFRAAAASSRFACGISTGDGLFCWGTNFNAPSTGGYDPSRPVPAPVLPGIAVRSVTAGPEYACLIDGQATVRCWGTARDGQLGTGDPYASSQAQPVPVFGGRSYSSASAGAVSACALTLTGEAFCWGSNADGQLGNASVARSNAPLAVSTPLRFLAIAAGFSHTCAIALDKSAYCWGDNQLGQLGTGAVSNSSTPVTTPVAVAGGLRFTSITGGRSHSCALTPAGQAYCWGDNQLGQLGTGDFVPHAAPTPVAGGRIWKRIHTSGYQTCGITDADLLYCWGYQNATPRLQEGQQ